MLGVLVLLGLYQDVLVTLNEITVFCGLYKYYTIFNVGFLHQFCNSAVVFSSIIIRAITINMIHS